ncbi:MAG: TolC family protein [Candidatus Krumholzibacteria bacterium]|nr:TolC family protein [Candidatus Krumholzibacteria bacterium]
MNGRFCLFFVLILVLSAPMVMVQTVRAQEYTLERCIEIALDVSPAVGISRENLARSRTNVLQNYGNFLPSATASFRMGRSFAGPTSGVVVDAQGRPIPPTGFDYDTYVLSFSGGMTLFNWGTNRRQLQQSKASAEAAVYNLEYQKDFIKAIVIREYYNLIRQIKLGDVSEENVELNKRNLEQVEAFYNIGSRTKAEFLQARVTLANSKLEYLNVQNAEVLARQRLLSRLNLPRDTPLDLDESLNITPGEVEVEAEIDYMMGHRSDLLGSREEVAAAKYAVSAWKNSRYPDLTGFYSYSWNQREWDDFAAMFDENYVWSLGLGLNWNIFDRFLTKSSVMNAEATTRIAEYNLQQAEIDALLELDQIVANLKQAKERLELARETVTHAQENVRLADERYRVGAGTILETIVANASLTEAQAQLVEAEIDYLINRADLQRATGRPISTE